MIFWKNATKSPTEQHGSDKTSKNNESAKRGIHMNSSVYNPISSSYDEPSFAGVAAFVGEGDEPMLGAVALSCLTKKALRFVNSAARELSGMILAPEASTAIVRRRVPDLSVSQAVPTE